VKLLCGISDGRGKICGRRLGPGTWERWVGARNAADIVLEGEHSVVSMCPKHGVVAIEKAEFETAQRDGSVAVHFRRRTPGMGKSVSDAVVALRSGEA
jgi:hypothetical protein